MAADPPRVPPADCIAEARRYTNMAYGSSDPAAVARFTLDAVDWMRRGVEQMAAPEPESAAPRSPTGSFPENESPSGVQEAGG